MLPIKTNKIRIFGSTECKNCLTVFTCLVRERIHFEYIDAFSEDESVQTFCDKYDVDSLPHIQFLSENNDILFEHIGPIDSETLLGYIIEYLPDC